jgi:hypothetical protein
MRVRELVEQNPEAATSCSPDGFPVVALAAAFGTRMYRSAVAGSHASVAKWLAENGAGADLRAHQRSARARGTFPTSADTTQWQNICGDVD